MTGSWTVKLPRNIYARKNMTGSWSVKLPRKCGILTLQTHHEVTNHVKETKIDIDLRKFDLFKMKEDESINQCTEGLQSL
jgi:hypothetical protein